MRKDMQLAAGSNSRCACPVNFFSHLENVGVTGRKDGREWPPVLVRTDAQCADAAGVALTQATFPNCQDLELNERYFASKYPEMEDMVLLQVSSLKVDAETVAISGLDGYHTTQSLGRWSYAKTDREVTALDDPARGWEDMSG